jgi:uncharacterized DUF497 family protein
MSEPQFSWDPRKAQENAVKHGVSFDEAATAFHDENGLRIFDPDHSAKEERYLLLAMSGKARLLVVSHCFRKKDYGHNKRLPC